MNYNNTLYSSVYFDVDSTLVDIEGLDELAAFYGKKDEVYRLTQKSMSGEVKLEDLFALKMAIIQPSRSDFEKLGKLYLKHVTEDALGVIKVLHFLKKRVLIMTGNFYPAVRVLSQYLQVDDYDVFANKIYFDEHDRYLSFDSRGPLSVAGGKRSLMTILKRDSRKAVFVGDSSTDLDTAPPVELFIGYGGVIKRESVRKHSNIYVLARSLASILPFILTREECRQIKGTEHESLFQKGLSLANSGLVERSS